MNSREHFKKLIGIWVKEKSLDDRFVSRLDDKMKETEYKGLMMKFSLKSCNKIISIYRNLLVDFKMLIMCKRK